MKGLVGKMEYTLLECDLIGQQPIWSDPDDFMRIYISRTFGDGSWVTLSCAEPTNCYDWDDPETTIRVVFDADVIDFDGVRHLEFNRNGIPTDGYFYYPDINNLVDALTFLRDYTKEFTKEYLL